MELPLVEELPEADFGIFRRNILSFVGILKAQDTDMLLLTQTHTWVIFQTSFLNPIIGWSVWEMSGILNQS